MPSANKDDQTINPMDDLFGEPPLIQGEDKERYFRLLAAVRQEIKPINIFDELSVHDMADKFWEQQRCKQNVAALVARTFIEALACLLLAAMAPNFLNGDAAMEIAREYYGGHANPKRMDEIDSLLVTLGIGKEHIRAKAMQLCGADISMFNRMATSCETAIRQLRKELRPQSQNDIIASPSLVPKKIIEK